MIADRRENLRAHQGNKECTGLCNHMAPTPETLLTLAERRGLLTLAGKVRRGPRDSVEVGAYVVGGWDRVAGWLSTAGGWVVWPSKRGVTILSGSKVLCRVLQSYPASHVQECGRKVDWWEEGGRAALVARSVTGDEFPGDVGAVCRRLWERVGVSVYPYPEQVERLTSADPFYVSSAPGLYPETYYKVDIANCYGSLLAKLESPVFKAYKSGAVKFSTKDIDMAAWRQLQECARRDKAIGRLLYGTSRARPREFRRWSSGVSAGVHLGGGPYPLAGLLVARLALELVARQAQAARAIHAYTDCIVSPAHPEELNLWAAAGLSFNLKGEGDADIHSPVIYRCGEDMTIPYRVLVRHESHPQPQSMRTLPRPVAIPPSLPRVQYSGFLV